MLQCYTTEKTPILRRLRRNTNGVTEVIQVEHKGVIKNATTRLSTRMH